MILKKYDLYVLGLICFLFLAVTNTYFNYDESLIFGALDGKDYFLISKNFPNFPNNDELSFHKAWRFIIPYLIGGISQLINTEIFFTYRIFVFIFSIFSILIFVSILEHYKIKGANLFFLILLLVFNPYMFRFFLAAPTMLNDLIFINSSLLILYGLIKKNKFIIFFAFILSVITRQNSIFFLIGFILLKLIFKKKSFFNFKDIIILLLIFLFLSFINTEIASNFTVYNESFSLNTRFAIFYFNYSSSELIKFIIFSFLVLFPPFLFFYINKKLINLNVFQNENFTFITLSSVMIIGIAFLGGPEITGKNINRLINLAYPLIIISLCNLVTTKQIETNNIKFYLYLICFVLWSFHPTFSIYSILRINLF